MEWTDLDTFASFAEMERSEAKSFQPSPRLIRGEDGGGEDGGGEDGGGEDGRKCKMYTSPRRRPALTGRNGSGGEERRRWRPWTPACYRGVLVGCDVGRK
ncbi:hypothetical protein RirG_010700 [Rhizophagus irregularis DAOM 197198w]|uniref:Uncharacterized protein n=1 Tax=Rhizophagus irregularis (strain DAOM 197198w) TaxID=1432141 RepID=A0A015LGV3_RHIIW|nr:hypothetical protein RirG_010680 [Rhizophagus irregularis DAOM 197198w]EXX78909.1 hypothetical protein RirG_010700 [Rhizophagus irregularis DAOM 197198w]